MLIATTREYPCKMPVYRQAIASLIEDARHEVSDFNLSVNLQTQNQNPTQYRYDVEPFFWTSSINWIPARYQENINAGTGDRELVLFVLYAITIVTVTKT